MFNYSIAFLELIKLYNLATNNGAINKKDLETAFKELMEIIAEETNAELFYSYDFELQNFLKENSEFFESDDKEIHLLADIETIYSSIIKKIKTKSFDFRLAELVYNVDIYSALKIRIPTYQIAPFFNANKELLHIFTQLAYEECNGINQSSTLEDLEEKSEAFLRLFGGVDNSLLTKLKIAINIYDFKYLDSESEIDAYPWITILFSNDEAKWQTISYYIVALYCTEIDEILDEESEEALNAFFSYCETGEEVELSYFEIFLRFFLIYLNKFLSITGSFPNKESLIIKKYLLLSLPELESFKQHLIAHRNIDDLPFPKIPEKLNQEDMLDMLDMFALSKKLCSEIPHSDEELAKNPNIYAEIVAKAIFVKCYLKINPQQENKDFIISLITNPIFYKSKDYQITTDIIDNIIFSDALDLKRS